MCDTAVVPVVRTPLIETNGMIAPLPMIEIDEFTYFFKAQNFVCGSFRLRVISLFSFLLVEHV